MTDRNFALPPLGKAALVSAVIFAVVVPLLIAAGLVVSARQSGLDPLLALGLQALVAAIVLAVVLPLWRRRVAFDGRRLRVEATFYTRESPLADFRLDQARVVNLHEHAELRPGLKSNGYALPGFQAGHFRLRDVKRKAFCLVTDATKVVALPHADGRVWLLSFEHPQAVLDILRRAT